MVTEGNFVFDREKEGGTGQSLVPDEMKKRVLAFLLCGVMSCCAAVPVLAVDESYPDIVGGIYWGVDKPLEGKKYEGYDFYFDKETGTVTSYVRSRELKDIVIPETVDGVTVKRIYGGYEYLNPEGYGWSISEFGAFESDFFVNINSIVLPNTLESIAANAFYWNDSLKEIVIPDSVTSLGASAFRRCSNLERVVLPKNIKVIPAGLFAGCKKLTEVVIPDGVTALEGFQMRITELSNDSVNLGAFLACSSLKDITIPNSVTSMGEFVFAGCKSLNELSIPDSVTSIGDFAFRSCAGLEKIKLSKNIKVIPTGMLSNCRSLKSVTIPDGVEAINDDFTQYPSKEEDKSFYNLYRYTGDYLRYTGAFADCANLEKVLIPASVTAIGENAFNGSEKVTIYTEPGAYAESYAQEHGIPCKYITDYEVDKVHLTDGEGNVLEAIPAAGEFTLNADIMKNCAIDKAVIVTGLYDETGKMIGAQIDRDFLLDMPEEETKTFTGSISQPEGQSIEKIKVFVWDSTQNMTPLSNIGEI